MPSNETVHKRDDAREISTISSAYQTSQMSAEDIVKDGVYLHRSVFVRFMAMREEQMLVRAFEIQKENWE